MYCSNGSAITALNSCSDLIRLKLDLMSINILLESNMWETNCQICGGQKNGHGYIFSCLLYTSRCV